MSIANWLFFFGGGVLTCQKLVLATMKISVSTYSGSNKQQRNLTKQIKRTIYLLKKANISTLIS